MGSYRRRYRKRRNNGSESIFGLVLILAALAYAKGISLDSALTYAVATCLTVLPIVIAIASWKWWQARRNRFRTDPNIDINEMSGLDFERYVAALLEKQGYTNVRLTEYYDYGVDIIARKDGITWGVQVKRASGIVKAAAVRQVVTALKKYDCDRAMVVTNSTFSRPATELAKSNDCLLISL